VSLVRTYVNAGGGHASVAIFLSSSVDFVCTIGNHANTEFGFGNDVPAEALVTGKVDVIIAP